MAQAPCIIISFMLQVPPQEDGRQQTPEIAKQFAQETVDYLKEVFEVGIDGLDEDLFILKGTFNWTHNIDMVELPPLRVVE